MPAKQPDLPQDDAIIPNNFVIKHWSCANSPAPSSPGEFIAHDWCGWNESQGRFTHMPSGKTLLCQQWMGQLDWDRAQHEWFSQYAGSVIVHRCPTGPYRETGNIMGTVAEILLRLQARHPFLVPPEDPKP